MSDKETRPHDFLIHLANPLSYKKTYYFFPCPFLIFQTTQLITRNTSWRMYMATGKLGIWWLAM